MLERRVGQMPSQNIIKTPFRNLKMGKIYKLSEDKLSKKDPKLISKQKIAKQSLRKP